MVRRRTLLTGALAVLPVLAGCTAGGPNIPEPTAASTPYQPFGEPCASVPDDYAVTSDLPVSAAVAAEPLLTNLDVLLQQSGLGPALDAAPALTVLAPVDAAFQVLPPDTYQANLTAPRLGPLLAHHVLDVRLSADQLSPGQDTRNGDRGTYVPVDGAARFPADGTLLRQVPASVCGTLETANATVLLIDSVLQPSG